MIFEFVHLHKIMGFNPKSAETLAKWYLRFNGYFIVDSFVIHDDSSKLFRGRVRNHTEIDILGIRNKFSEEIPILETPLSPHLKLINSDKPEIDFIIAEVKTGKERKLNAVWNEKTKQDEKQKQLQNVKYILRFAGFIENDQILTLTAQALISNGKYISQDRKFSARLVLISENVANKNWKEKILNILFEDIIQFIIDDRNCYYKSGVQTSESDHPHWDVLINEIFSIANKNNLVVDKRRQEIEMLLAESDFQIQLRRFLNRLNQKWLKFKKFFSN